MRQNEQNSLAPQAFYRSLAAGRQAEQLRFGEIQAKESIYMQ